MPLFFSFVVRLSKPRDEINELRNKTERLTEFAPALAMQRTKTRGFPMKVVEL